MSLYGSKVSLSRVIIVITMRVLHIRFSHSKRRQYNITPLQRGAQPSHHPPHDTGHSTRLHRIRTIIIPLLYRYRVLLSYA